MPTPPTTTDPFLTYAGNLPEPQRTITRKLIALVRKNCPKATEAIKWNLPWWDHHGKLAYVAAYSKHVNLGLARGARLADPDKLLQGTGAGLRHIKIRSLDDIDTKVITAMIKSAVRHNESEESPRLKMGGAKSKKKVTPSRRPAR